MKTLFSIQAPLLIFFASFLFVSTQNVEAKSVTWNTSGVPELYYYWNYNAPYPNYSTIIDSRYSGYSPAIDANSNVSITYRAILETSPGTIVNDGTTVPVGTVVNVKWNRDDTDISWIGTGHSVDSPYGTWRNNASDPADYCTNYFVNHVNDVIGVFVQGWDVYIPLSVHPPVMFVTATNASCVGTVCTVTGSGPVSITATFPATYGNFYYRYYGTGAAGIGCYVNPGKALQTCMNPLTQIYLGVPFKSCLPPSSTPVAYSLSVPAQAITYNLNSITNNNPPTTPTITGPTGGTTNNPYTFAAIATDPDGDTVQYGFDWDNNGSVDAWTPLVPSGTSQSLNRSFPLAQGYTFQVLAKDSSGSQSGWATHTITLTLPAGPTITTEPTVPVSSNSITINGKGNPNGNATTGWFRYDTTNPESCNDTFGTRVPASGGTALGAGTANVVFSENLTGLTPGTTYYYCAIGQSVGGIAYGAVLNAMTAPATPTGLAATPNASCGTGQITVSWNAVTSATSYTLRDGGTNIYTGAGTSFTHSSLAADSSHSYSVSANNTTGSSAFSTAVSGTAPSACVIPTFTCTGTQPTGDAYSCGSPVEPTDATDAEYALYPISAACTYSGVDKCDWICEGTYDSNNICTNTTTPLPPTGNPTLAVNPRIVEIGSSATLSWTLNGQAGCTLTGGTLSGIDQTYLESKTEESITVSARTTYTLSCTSGGTAKVIVEIVPRGYES